MDPTSFRQATRDILELVENSSGYPVYVEPNPEITTPSSMRMARGTQPFHLVSYRPTAGDQPPDYQIAVQCGYILRHFAAPPEDRFDIAPSGKGQREIERMVDVTSPALRQSGVSAGVAAVFRQQLHDGLVVQLRSIPVGLRIDEWLIQSYPELRPLQKEAVGAQLVEAAGALQSDIRAITPGRVYRASTGMNAAFAAFWARFLDDPSITQPYTKAGLDSLARDLLHIYDDTGDEPSQDRELVDAWAHCLGVAGWYDWVPYLAPTLDRIE